MTATKDRTARQATMETHRNAEHIGKVARKAVSGLTIVPDSEYKEEGISSVEKDRIYSTVAKIPAKFRRKKYADMQDEKDAVTLAKMYGADGSGWLFVYGQSGSGKSMLASIIARHILVEHVIPIEWMNAVEIMNELKSTWGKNSGSERDIISRYTKAGLLVVDDFGAEGEDDHAIKTMYLILNKRSERMYPTIITSNLGLEDIQQSSVRIADRILRETEGRRIKMRNGSFYLKGK